MVSRVGQGRRQVSAGAEGGVAGCLQLSLLYSPALTPRLSPEVYLKRPAHSDDWRLDFMLKKAAVRSRAGGGLGRDCLWVYIDHTDRGTS